MDYSGEKPHDEFNKNFPSHAGVVTAEKPQRPFRRQNFNNQAVMDTVLYGRDLDRSGDDPHKAFMSTYDQHAGLVSGNRNEGHTGVAPRQMRKPGLTQKCAVDDVVFGKDMKLAGMD